MTLDELAAKYPAIRAAVESGEMQHCGHCGTLWTKPTPGHRCLGMAEAELAAERKRVVVIERLRGIIRDEIDPTGELFKELRKVLGVGPLTSERDRLAKAIDEIKHLRSLIRAVTRPTTDEVIAGNGPGRYAVPIKAWNDLENVVCMQGEDPADPC
jgi:hypothetical protein